MSTQLKRFVRAEEYLSFDRTALNKNEYVDGEIFAMGGASARHVQIVGNIVRELGNQLRDRPCLVYGNDLRVCISPTGHYAYPDVVVVCGEPQFLDKALDTLTNPLLIVEVLSESTKDDDRGEKFRRYQAITSFQEYLLVSQEKAYVERFIRQSDHRWVLFKIQDLSAVVDLSSVGCSLSMAEIYLKVSGINPET